MTAILKPNWRVFCGECGAKYEVGGREQKRTTICGMCGSKFIACERWDPDCTTAWLEANGVPLTREAWLSANDVREGELDGEQEASLPRYARLDYYKSDKDLDN